MKIFILIAGLLFSFLAFAQEELRKTDPILFLTQQNYRVLSARVHKILEYRLSSPDACLPEIQKNLKKRFAELPKYSDQKEIVTATLDLYYFSHHQERKCQQSLDNGEKRFLEFERKKFKFYHYPLSLTCLGSKDDGGSLARNCALRTEQVLSDLDPHCVFFQVPNFTGNVDNFPCMMADFMIGKSVVTDLSWSSYNSNTAAYLENLRKYFALPENLARGVDLWAIYKNGRTDSPALREEFLARLNFFFSSSQSASSYIRGFHDHIWRFVLEKTGSGAQALDYFITSRLHVDEFLTLFRWAEKNKIPMNVHGIKTEFKNRHNYMAAFLACHYRAENRLVHESLPVFLGYGYESLDFVDHIVNDHDSFAAAKENFVTDTDRYRTGVYWGYRFCRMN